MNTLTEEEIRKEEAEETQAEANEPEAREEVADHEVDEVGPTPVEANPEDDVTPDDIAAEYNTVLEHLAEKRQQQRWWERCMKHEYMQGLVDKMQAEIDERKLNWEDIKPKDFALDQARVIALSEVLDELRDKPDSLRSEISALLSQKTQLESSYPMFIDKA